MTDAQPLSGGTEDDPFGKRRIYLASSWRNQDQPRLVGVLRDAGHEVYDFRNPAPGSSGFAWSAIDKDWMHWTPEAFRECLDHPTAKAGYKLDKDACDWADTCVLLLPCGRSAHLEAGYAAGAGKRLVVYLSPDKFEPELMYRFAGDPSTAIVTTDAELLSALSRIMTGAQRTPADFSREFAGYMATAAESLLASHIEHPIAFTDDCRRDDFRALKSAVYEWRKREAVAAVPQPLSGGTEDEVERIFTHIKHGDAEHQAWLKGKLQELFALSRPSPEAATGDVEKLARELYFAWARERFEVWAAVRAWTETPTEGYALIRDDGPQDGDHPDFICPLGRNDFRRMARASLSAMGSTTGDSVMQKAHNTPTSADAVRAAMEIFPQLEKLADEFALWDDEESAMELGIVPVGRQCTNVVCMTFGDLRAIALFVEAIRAAIPTQQGNPDED